MSPVDPTTKAEHARLPRRGVPLLPVEAVSAVPTRAREVVEYRKSGLSLNHVQGCPLDCAYCIRHTYGLWDSRQPRALMSDAEAVEELIGHRYFQAHVTPVQIFNRATDPFLPGVKDHLFAVLEDLDARELTNHVLVITRAVVHQADYELCDRYVPSGLVMQRFDGVDPAFLWLLNSATGRSWIALRGKTLTIQVRDGIDLRDKLLTIVRRYRYQR